MLGINEIDANCLISYPDFFMLRDGHRNFLNLENFWPTLFMNKDSFQSWIFLLGRSKKLKPQLGWNRRDGDKPFFKATESLETFFELSHGHLRELDAGLVDTVNIGNDRSL